MPTKLRSTGLQQGTPPTAMPYYSRKFQMETTNNTCVIVLCDRNSSSTNAGYGDQTNVSKIYIWESNTTRTSWTLRLTITLAANLDVTTGVMQSCEIFSNNDIGIIYKSTNGDIKYRKITYATWTSAAEETVLAVAASTQYDVIEMSISDRNIPIVGIVTDNASSSNLIIRTRRTSDSTWQTSVTQLIANNILGNRAADVAVTCLKGVGSGTASLIAFTSSGATSTYSTDFGVRMYTTSINESTAAATGTALRGTFSVDTMKNLSTSGPIGPQRKVGLWSNAAGEFVFASWSQRASAGVAGTHMQVGKFTWDGTTFTTLTQHSATFTTALNTTLFQKYGIGMTYGADGIHISQVAYSGKNVIAILGTVVKFNASGGPTFFSGTNTAWANAEVSTGNFAQVLPSMGSDKNVNYNHDMVFFVDSGAGYAVSLWHEWDATLRGAALYRTPSGGATVSTPTPALAVDMDLDRKYPRVPVGLTFEFAQDFLFSIGLKTYVQDASKFQTPIGTDAPGVILGVQDVWPQSLALAQGTWYTRVFQTDAFGKSAGDPFGGGVGQVDVSHPPAATPTSPVGGKFLPYGGGQVIFSWNFSDPYTSDTQTAYQVICERNDTGAAVFDSGKITSTSKSYTSGVISAALKEIELRWKVRVWDSEDIPGSYSAYQTFRIGDPPSVVINTPVNNAVLTTSRPAMQATVTIGASRTLQSYRFVILQGSTVIYDSGVVIANPGQTGAVVINNTPAFNELTNTQSYTIQVYAQDSQGLSSNVAQVNVTTSWILPATIASVTASAALYGTAGSGYNTITWPDTLRDTDFQQWAVYRRVSQINPQTQAVFEAGTVWELVGYDYDNVLSTHVMRDYYAPSGCKVEYKVTQIVNRFGDIVEGADSNIVTVYPSQDGYWLISEVDPQAGGTAFRLGSTVSDSYTSEYEEDEYTVVGRGRRIDRGEKLGVKGSLGVALRDNATATARQMKRQIEDIKEDNKVIYIRTPFGDVYRVAAGNIGVGRIAGVALNEFVDIEIPYSEIGE